MIFECRCNICEAIDVLNRISIFDNVKKLHKIALSNNIWLNLLYNFIVAKRTNEKHNNCWINNLFIRLRRYVLFHVYIVLNGKP
jgi:hypothetical protein